MTEAVRPDVGDSPAWREVISDAVDLLLRQAERRLDDDSPEAFASRNPATVLVLQTERARVRDLRERLRMLRPR